MATLTGTRAGANFPVFQNIGSGALSVAYGSYTLSANPTIADVIQLCKLPKGAIVLGGWLRGGDIDTNGTPTLDIDVGWAADPDGFGNLGVLNGTAVTNYLPEGGFLIPFHGTLRDGFVSFSSETVLQATITAAAATFAAGTLSFCVFFVTA
jgi:hypothetical protein